MTMYPGRTVYRASMLALVVVAWGTSSGIARAHDAHHPAPSAAEAPSVPPAPPSSYVPPAPAPAPYAGHHGGHLFDPQYRSPGLAVALSLTPMPVDFGNFYAENLGWGVFYTAVEVSLAVPMLWIGSGNMGMGGSRNDTREWSDSDRNAFVALLSGYIAVKLGAGLHAGHAARDLNDRLARRPYAAVVPLPGGASALVGMRF